MNKTFHFGRLTKDVELRHSQTGKAVAQFSLAVDKFVNGKKGADFFNFVAWDKLAENLAQYKHKGDQILVEGRLQNRSYEAQDGSTRYVTEIICNNIEFTSTGQRQNSPADSFGAVAEDEVIPF